MIAITAFARTPNLPTSLRTLQLGSLRLNETEPSVSMRRYHVREWRPADGGMPGWKWRTSGFIWSAHLPRRIDEYFVITRLVDGAIAIAPRRWWRCDPRGMPRDRDSWAHAAWRAIEAHYEQQRQWWLG